MNEEALLDYKSYYEEHYLYIEKKYSIEHVFLVNNSSWDQVIPEKFVDHWWSVIFYVHDNDAIEACLHASIWYDDIKVITFNEHYIYLSNQIKSTLWQLVTKDFELFHSKDIQREKMMQSEFEDLWVTYLEFDLIEDISIPTIEKSISYPFVIKPSRWASSSWVFIINDETELLKVLKDLKKSIDKLSERWYTPKKMLIEEFIDGQMFTIDYYVNESWEFHVTWLVKSYITRDLRDVNDISTFKQFLCEQNREEISKDVVKEFLKKTIGACGIKNTFIHHEFKLTSKWICKTIELNGRIWWYRLQMYWSQYWWSLLESMYSKIEYISSKNSNVVLYEFVPEKSWVKYSGLNDFNLWYENRKSDIVHFNDWKKVVWSTIWLAKNWFRPFASLILKIDEKNTSLDKKIDTYIIGYLKSNKYYS